MRRKRALVYLCVTFKSNQLFEFKETQTTRAVCMVFKMYPGEQEYPKGNGLKQSTSNSALPWDRWSIFIIGPYMILLLYTYHAQKIQIPEFIHIQYPSGVEFYKTYETYLMNNFDTNLQKWQNNLTLLMEDSNFCNKEAPPELVVFFKTT
ncbi:hypothetical protein X801_00164 [Opisthorchis viverrini]|uniref:Uncharacterized protein n=1 Tax=Opisthorchis viverrini TaxID=6198 RepID=A0A1S8XB38_OPIVI|nr:hypothetical protein X801_00164 [Opisthorchis viverrini]